MVSNLLKFLDASPVNFLAVKNICDELEQGGFRRLDPREPLGKVNVGDKFYVTKDQGRIGNTPGWFKAETQNSAGATVVDWYYAKEDGSLYFNSWLEDGGNWYYLRSNGQRARNGSIAVQDSYYAFDSEGRLIRSRLAGVVFSDPAALETLNSVTNYHLHKALYSGLNDHNFFEIAHTIKRQRDMGLGNKVHLYNFVDNHDVERIYTKLNNKAHFPLVHILLFTLPGIPSLYYGSEFGIEGRKERYSDASIRPKLDLDELMAADNEHVKLIGELAKIHNEHPQLSYGDYSELQLTTTKFAYARDDIIIALNNSDDIAKEIADAFRKRRIEKNLTREQVAEQSGVAVSNIVRFEQKGLISLKNLIGIATALGYTSEIKSLFAQPKYSTMEELTQIRKNQNKKKAHRL